MAHLHDVQTTYNHGVTTLFIKPCTTISSINTHFDLSLKEILESYQSTKNTSAELYNLIATDQGGIKVINAFTMDTLKSAIISYFSTFKPVSGKQLVAIKVSSEEDGLILKVSYKKSSHTCMTLRSDGTTVSSGITYIAATNTCTDTDKLLRGIPISSIKTFLTIFKKTPEGSEWMKKYMIPKGGQLESRALVDIYSYEQLLDILPYKLPEDNIIDINGTKRIGMRHFTEAKKDIFPGGISLVKYKQLLNAIEHQSGSWHKEYRLPQKGIKKNIAVTYDLYRLDKVQELHHNLEN